jgi:hypothetical protein
VPQGAATTRIRQQYSEGKPRCAEGASNSILWTDSKGGKRRSAQQTAAPQRGAAEG